MIAVPLLLFCVALVNSDTSNTSTPETVENQTFPNTRRILRGKPTGNTRPYMVYLRPLSLTNIEDPNWTCGGVIIHPFYILTSAACIEDIHLFLVISGTHKWIRNDETSECIENGAIRAISKCIPKEFVFDGHEFDNAKWMRDDIAVVKVETPFNFEKRVRGCDYVPDLIKINNISLDMEAAGTIASIAGWGSNTIISTSRASNNSQELLENSVQIITTESCKARWPTRYHHIIDYKIICTQDSMTERFVKCGTTDCNENPDFGLNTLRRFHANESVDHDDLDDQNNDTRRTFVSGGGFCHNDHGGPLIVGQGTNAAVIGVITASQHNDINHRCYGPFLYTSVWKNQHLINCVLGDKTCELDQWMTCCVLEDELKMRII